MTAARGARRIAGLAAIAAVIVLGAAVAASSRPLWIWWRLRSDFDRVSGSGDGLPLYRHRRTGLLMALVPGGEAIVGSEPTERGSSAEERPRRTVRLSPFLIALTELSQGEWRRVMSERFFLVRGDELPVHGVSWVECESFLARSGLSFPTEAQWEHACRAGTLTRYCFGDELDPALAVYGGAGRPAPAGTLVHESGARLAAAASGAANAFGLVHVHGNVEEWCADGFAPDAYARLQEGELDPVRDERTDSRVVRGGSFASSAAECRSARRGALPSSSAATTAGLRPVYNLR